MLGVVFEDRDSAHAKERHPLDRVYRVDGPGKTLWVIARSPQRACSFAADSFGLRAKLDEPRRISPERQKAIEETLRQMSPDDRVTVAKLLDALDGKR